MRMVAGVALAESFLSAGVHPHGRVVVRGRALLVDSWVWV